MEELVATLSKAVLSNFGGVWVVGVVVDQGFQLAIAIANRECVQTY
jgi:hypothetical protein